MSKKMMALSHFPHLFAYQNLFFKKQNSKRSSTFWDIILGYAILQLENDNVTNKNWEMEIRIWFGPKMIS